MLKVPYENLKKANLPFEEEFTNSFKNCLKSGWYILGNEVKQFEENFAKYCGTQYCIGVASGLDALILSLVALDLPSGSEVIVPSNTYIASILAILRADLTPILVEPDIRTYNLCPQKLRKAISSKTRVILPVHLYGKLSAMQEIRDIASEYNLKIVEDCAQAHGARQAEHQAGNSGDLGAFSFYPTKNLGALGDGGAITTDSFELYEKIKCLRNYGSNKKYYNELLGFNSRLDEIQASFLNIKLRHLQKITDHKRMLADLYHEKLSEFYTKPVRDNNYYDVFHIYNVRTPKRDMLKSFLASQGIGTEIHYPIAPIDQVAMKNILNQDTPIAKEIHHSTLSLPISYANTAAEINYVIEKMNEFAKKEA